MIDVRQTFHSEPADNRPNTARVGSPSRRLIVNADDFGLSHGVNRGILAAHRHGIVTSASLMVRWPAAEEAVTLSRECSSLSLGLHVDLGEWAYRDGQWVTLYQVVDAQDARAVAAEIARQLDWFRELTGCDPTHLDSHQHVHYDEPVRSILRQFADELAVPLRHFSPHIRYCGRFYGQTAKGVSHPAAISRAALIELLRELPPGTTELACHPGFDDDLATMYARERALEVATLCDDDIRAALDACGIELCSFSQITQAAAVSEGRV